MAERRRAGFQLVVWFAAANFAALVIATLAALATGAVSVESIGGASRVLGGSSSAVPVDELAALKDARAKLEGRGPEAELMDAWTSYWASKNDFDKRRIDERKMIKGLAADATKARKEFEEARDELKAARAADSLKKELEASARKQNAFNKVKGVYRYMRPTEVARDFEARLAANRVDEVAQILNAMNDRAAAEALEAIADPANRILIYNALAGVSSTAVRP